MRFGLERVEPCGPGAHCPHTLTSACGRHNAPPETGLMWCCRCNALLIVPSGLGVEEKTHGVFTPRVLPPEQWRRKK